MTPNLRSVVAQGWRSIHSRRNFSSSSSGSTNESKSGGRTVLSWLTTNGSGLAKRGLYLMGGYLFGVVVTKHPLRDLLGEDEIEEFLRKSARE
ncbi:PREDICTED: uncharacterized protein LOC104744893 isoform X2 [Camelina sativa]|uniref:Uncharacterized protein LOC104744893 isoform X2 n=1 Tax=Camelina sativa TaxID=90675 RepID=A0ABM0W1D2_CAMSA|nr:PREDICTED: uncharacterized protein LOC104744893 isoform X2 [Camelina sativa]